ncbi:MAG: hypothetical protein GXZ04_05695 [Clostridiales bacterium]|nr:hypothetical protein [Clostridiales bacterium]
MNKNRRMLALILSMLVLFSTCGAMFAEAPNLTDEELAAIDLALQDENKDVPVQEGFRIQVSPDDLSVTEGLDENWMNILLLGTDTGSIQLNYGRTDTMIILSVNKVTGKMKLASLVRDMKVDLPIYNRPAKINAANAYGGPLLAVKTVNETFGLNIRHYVSINFKGFKNVIDQLGGVELLLNGSESKIVGVRHLDEPQLLNGEQALEYVRIRMLDNNFGRNERQRKLLNSLFNKILKGSNMQQAMEALTEAIQHMATNLSINDLLSLVIPVFTGMEQMDTIGFPAEGDYRYQYEEPLASAVVFKLEETKQKLHDYIYQGITQNNP